MNHFYSIQPVEDGTIFDAANRALSSYGVRINPMADRMAYLLQGDEKIGYAHRSISSILRIEVFPRYEGSETRKMLDDVNQAFRDNGLHLDTTPKPPRPEDTRIELYHKGRYAGTLEDTGLTPEEIAKLTYRNRHSKD